jgi:RNA polymerase sigma-70 factor (ECF subfamily)
VKEDAPLDDGFFRHESARLLVALTRVFGIHNLALAEDVVQETLARAFEAWSFRGVPAHASALLMTTAKNRALDVLRHRATALRLAPEVGRMLDSEWTRRPVVDELFLPAALADDELRMIFTCCQPRLPEDVQVALVLNVLCGFGTSEVASAFLVSDAAMEKRLARGKRALAESQRLFELVPGDVAERLPLVHRALYLLFNEGYHGACAQAVVRRDLVREAMRLVKLLVEHAPAATPATHALAALMWLGAARLPARIDEGGNLKALFEQDRTLWDARLIEEGLALLEASATGEVLSVYHVEAGIAALHATASRPEDTPWGDIVGHYEVLLRLSPSPVVALARAIAVAEHEGPARGLEEVQAIRSSDRLEAYPFHAAALGELELRLGHHGRAHEHFVAARALARNEGERRFLDQRLLACDEAARRRLA